MGRRRTAWLVNGNGVKTAPSGAPLPGFYVRWTEARIDGCVNRSRCFPSRKMARDFLIRHNAHMALQGDRDTIIPTLISDAEPAFITALAGRSGETTRQYMVSIHRFVEICGDLELGTLDRRHIDHFLMTADCQEATLDKHLRHLSRFFRWCITGRLMEQDITKLATSRPRRGIARKRPLLDAQGLQQLIDRVPEEDRKIAIQLAATTGLDRGAIAALTAEDFDLKTKQFRLTRAKTQHEVFPFLHDALVPAIRRKIRRSAPGVPLFSGVLRSSARRKDWFREAARAAGLPDLLFRDLRSYAVNWARQALADFDVQKMLGHSTPAVTAKHYHQLDPAKQRSISSLPLPGSAARPAAGKKRSA